MISLDRSRHFCTLYGLPGPGDLDDGAVFIQDGIRFNGLGEEVGRELEYFPEWKKDKVKKKVPSGDATTFSKVLEKHAPNTTSAFSVTPLDDSTAVDDASDLI